MSKKPKNHFAKRSQDEEKFLADCAMIFNRSELLKGKPPHDKIWVTYTSEFKNHLDNLSKEEPSTPKTPPQNKPTT